MKRGWAILVLFHSLLLPLNSAELQNHNGGWRGIWLENDQARIFVATEPRLRILHFSLQGEPNFLRDVDDDVSGIKTGFLAPGHTPYSFAISEIPANILNLTDYSIDLQTAVEPSSGLQVTWEIKLSPTEAEIFLTHSITNHNRDPQTLAVWSLIAVPSRGRLSTNNLEALFPLAGQPLETAAHNFTSGIYTLDLEAPIHPYILQTGARARQPAFLYEHGSGTLSSRVPSSEGPWSPPGINLLFYVDVSFQEQFAEFEHLGPLREIASGESVTMVQCIRLNRLSSSSSPLRNSAENPLELNFLAGENVRTTADSKVRSWSALLEGVPVLLEPLQSNIPPTATPDNIQFNKSPLYIPRLAPFQSAGENTQRSMEVEFIADNNQTISSQVIAEMGGSGNGYNLWVESGRIFAGAWGKNPDGSIQESFLGAPLLNGRQTVRIEMLPASQLFKLFVNGTLMDEGALPAIQPHRDTCGLGGVAGTTRIDSIGVVHEGDYHYTGAIYRFVLTSHLADL